MAAFVGSTNHLHRSSDPEELPELLHMHPQQAPPPVSNCHSPISLPVSSDGMLVYLLDSW